MEIFTNIYGYEGLYQVSNLGNVKSLNYLHTGQEKILSPAFDKDGYLFVQLCKNGEAKNYRVHRLVAQAFLPNPNNYPCINHKDENKLNNNVDNLEWCTIQYNNEYSKAKQVGQYDLNGNLIATWKSTMEIQRQLGFRNGNISNCCLGKIKTAYGYIWKYIN